MLLRRLSAAPNASSVAGSASPRLKSRESASRAASRRVRGAMLMNSGLENRDEKRLSGGADGAANASCLVRIGPDGRGPRRRIVEASAHGRNGGRCVIRGGEDVEEVEGLPAVSRRGVRVAVGRAGGREGSGFGVGDERRRSAARPGAQAALRGGRRTPVRGSKRGGKRRACGPARRGSRGGLGGRSAGVRPRSFGLAPRTRPSSTFGNVRARGIIGAPRRRTSPGVGNVAGRRAAQGEGRRGRRLDPSELRARRCE